MPTVEVFLMMFYKSQVWAESGVNQDRKRINSGEETVLNSRFQSIKRSAKIRRVLSKWRKNWAFWNSPEGGTVILKSVNENSDSRISIWATKVWFLFLVLFLMKIILTRKKVQYFVELPVGLMKFKSLVLGFFIKKLISFLFALRKD